MRQVKYLLYILKSSSVEEVEAEVENRKERMWKWPTQSKRKPRPNLMFYRQVRREIWWIREGEKGGEKGNGMEGNEWLNIEKGGSGVVNGKRSGWEVG